MYLPLDSFLKMLLREKMRNRGLEHLMNFYIDAYKDQLFFIKENELKLKVICPKELVLKRTIQLPSPDFYKKMPESYYSYKKEFRGNIQRLRRDFESWRTDYSKISKMLVEGDNLVLQIRTCSDELKKFALLFYNAGTFKLERTIYTDDYLLAAKDGKYYFFANGHPSLDDDTDECIINIYSFIDTK